MAEGAVQHADRLVAGVAARRDGVHDRREVEVDTGRAQLSPPRRGLVLERGSGHSPLDRGARHLRKTGTVQRLGDSALLVGGNQEAHPARGLHGGLRLDGVGHRPDGAHPPVAALDEPDRPNVLLRDGPDLVRTQAVVGQSEEDQLADPLPRRHLLKDPLRAARGRGSRWRGQRACRRAR